MPAEVIQRLTEAILERLDKLGDTISGVEARLFARIQKVTVRVNCLEEKVTLLKQDMTKSAPLPVEPVFPHPAAYLPPYLPGAQMTTPGSAPPLPNSESPQMFSLTALQDISNAVGSVHVQRDILDAAIQCCRSRRNLAARLAGRVFSFRERAGSNCQGVLGKTALNSQRVRNYSIWMQHLPLQRLEK